MRADNGNANQRNLYYENIKKLNEELEKLKQSSGVELDMYNYGIDVISSLDKYNKYETLTKETPKQDISYADANSLVIQMRDIVATYNQSKDMITANGSSISYGEGAKEIKHAASDLQSKCKRLASSADTVFKHKNKSDLAKKILGGVALFLGAALLIAGIIALVAATHGGIIAVAAPVIAAKITVNSVVIAATVVPMSQGGFLAAVASGGVLTALSGFGFFGGAAALRSAMKKNPSHHFRHFSKAASKASKAFDEPSNVPDQGFKR